MRALCGLLLLLGMSGLAAVDASADQLMNLGDEVEAFMRAAPSLAEQEKKICTTALPVSLSPLGLPNMCVKATLPDSEAGKCSYGVTLAVELENQPSPLFQAPIDLSTLKSCASAADLTGSPFATSCGANVQVCVDFHDNGQPSLRVGPDFVAGCPSIVVENCVLAGSVPLPAVSVKLGCFSIGEDCAKFTDCESCLTNNCGWCAAGLRDNFKCMAKGEKGPACNGECGGDDCFCNWHTDTCPETNEKYTEKLLKKNETELDVAQHEKRVEQLEQAVTNGSVFPLDGEIYECLPTSEIHHEASSHSAITAVCSILAAFLGLGLGVVLGKAGYWDKVFNRGGDSGLGDLGGLYNRHDV